MATMNLPQSSSAAVGSRPLRAARIVGLALLLGGAAFGALAQYKIVGPDGKVTYTDKPPSPSDIRIGGSAGSGSGESSGGLPYAVRQASARYPVTLYAAKSCSACDLARQWLRGHAIPFAEYSIDGDADVTQLKQRFNDGTVPVVTIGTQVLKGFSSSELQSYADAAGYPKDARLPGYSWPAAVPLAPRGATKTKTESATPSTPAAPGVTLPPPSQSGIQF